MSIRFTLPFVALLVVVRLIGSIIQTHRIPTITCSSSSMSSLAISRSMISMCDGSVARILISMMVSRSISLIICIRSCHVSIMTIMSISVCVYYVTMLAFSVRISRICISRARTII